METSKYQKIIDLITPNCFFGSAFASIVFSVILYPLVDKNETIRVGLSIVVNLIITGLMFLVLLKLFSREDNKKKIVISLWPIIWILLVYIINGFENGITGSFIVSFGITMVYSLQYSCTAIYLLNDKREQAFIKSLDYYGIALAVFSVVYIARFFFSKEENLISFSGMSYMTIAYALIVVVFTFIYKLMFLEEKSVWKYIVLAICWMAVVYSGTRGPLACTIFFLLVVMLYALSQKKFKTFFKLAILSVLMIGFVAFSVNVWSPAKAGTSGRLQNMDFDAEIYSENANDTIKDEYVFVLPNKQQVTAKDKSLQDLYSMYIIENDEKMYDSLDELKNNKSKDGEIIFSSENSELVKKFTGTELYLGRALRQDFAIGEFNKSKIFGNGPMYYLNKYDGYSHSIITDILCDFGIVGLVAFVVVMCSLLLLNIKRILNDKIVAFFAILSVSIAASYMMSGSMYQGGVWTFLCTFATYKLFEKKGNEV